MARTASISMALAAFFLSPQAIAQEPDIPQWGISATANATFATDDQASPVDETSSGDSLGGSVLLERYFETVTVGLSLGLAQSEVTISDTSDLDDALTYSVGGSVSIDTSVATVAGSVDYARQDYEGTQRGPLNGAVADIDGQSTYLTIGLSAGRVFGETTRFVPMAGISWSQTDTQTDVSATGPLGINSPSDQTQDGLSGMAGIGIARDVSPRITLYTSTAIVAAANEAAYWSTAQSSSNARVDAVVSRNPVTSGEDESAVWGEFGGGIAVRTGVTSMVSFDVTGTAGKAGDYVTTGLTFTQLF